jgi:energy-coupling factor transporter ATP-binding protein EcfA2
MTSLLEGAKKLVTRSPEIGARVEGLDIAVKAARGRLDDSAVDDAEAIVQRAAGRLRLSANHTVVGIAGATGSGKSSTFNALTELELSATGVRRPTTSWASACVWGSDGAAELLNWLGIPPRHQTTRDSMLSTGREDNSLQGVVLLDLPDHDSTEVSHHLEVNRLVQLADLLIWVLDPQKYADAAIHDRYLAPLSSHQDVTMVVLNHLDTVPTDRRAAMLDDVRRLLVADGMPKVPVMGISARQGWGIDELRSEIARRVAAKKATKLRMESDLKAAAQRMMDQSGSVQAGPVPDQRVAELEDAFADAAGVPTVVHAVEEATRIRAQRATGWPVTAWVSKLKPDPLKRLHLDLGSAGKQLTGVNRTSVPQATPVQRARVDAAVRELAEDVAGDLARPWAASVRRASVSNLDDFSDRLDRTLATTDLDAEKIPGWAGAVRFVQWVLIIIALTGGVWLAALAVMKYLDMPSPSTPTLLGLAVPLWMLVAGASLGVLLAFVCRLLVASTAKTRARTADRRLRDAISGVSDELVIAPIKAELAAYSTVRDGLMQTLK